MEKAQQNIKNGLESIIAEESATEASKKYFDGIAIAYSNGLASLTDAYLAEADYRDNELKLINSEADIVLSLTDIYYYSGKTSSRDIKELQQKFFK
jgi:outer membrane protein TolC